MLLLSSHVARAQGPLLIQEVISREVGINVGSVQTPEIKEVVSREVSIYVEWGANNQVISREFSLCMVNPTSPPVVGDTDVIVTASPKGDTVTLDWSPYNQWAVRDIAYYAIYYTSGPFYSVSNMTPYAIVPGEQLSITFTGLTEWTDHYFAVVPVDGLGNFNSNVIYSAAYVLMPQVISREVGLFVGQGPDNQVISREITMNYVDTNPPPRLGDTDIILTASPKGATVTLDWSPYNQWAVRDVDHYAVYYSSSPIYSITGMVPYRIVPGETFTTTFTGLTEWVDHFFVVAPVDGLGHFATNVIYSAAYVLFPQMISREVGLFVGQGPDKQVISREVTFLRADTNVPAAISYVGSPFDATASKTKYGAIDLNWSFYNEWAQRDVVRYRMYVSTQFFSDVSTMTPWAYSANGGQFDTVTNLGCEQIYYTAVVAEDAAGNFTTAVYSISAKASVCQLGEVSNLVGNAFVTRIDYTWDLGGIGTDLGFFVDYFNLYLNGSTNPIVVPGTNRSYVLTGLVPESTQTMRVTTVDIFGTESAGQAVTNVLGTSIAFQFFWTNNASHAFSSSGVWTNNEADGTIPIDGGSNRYMLIFRNNAPIVADNDLGRPAFELNRLLLWSNNVTLRGSQLVFRTASQTSLRPLVYLWSTNRYRVEASAEFPVLTTFDGVGAGALTMAGVISGEGTLIKSNVFTLTLEGTTTNTHTGRLIHQNGLMNFAKSNGATAVASGGIVQLGNDTAHQPTLRMSNSHQFAAGVVMVFSNAANNWTRFDLQGTTQALSGLHHPAGRGGIIQNERNGGGGTAGPALLIVSNEASHWYEGYLRDRDAGAGIYPLWFQKSGSGTQALAGANILHTGLTTVEDGRLVLNNTTAFTGGTGVVVQAGAELELNVPGIMRFQNTRLSGDGTVVKRGAGAMNFGNSGAPAFIEMGPSGLIDVQEGILQNAWFVGVWSNNLGSMHIATGATTLLWDADIRIDKLTGSGTVDKGQNNSHFLYIGVNHGSSTFDGVIRNGTGFVRLWKVGDGTFTLTGTNTANGLMYLNGGTLELAGGGVIGNGIFNSTVSNNAHLLLSGSATQAFTSGMRGTGLITRTGSGTLMMNVSNSFSGHLVVSSGVVLVNGLLVNGTIDVGPSGTLGGTGRVGATVRNAGMVAPGSNRVGRLTVSGTYTQAATGVLLIELGGATPGTGYDQLTVTGSASLDGALHVSFANAYHPATNQTFAILGAASRVGTFAVTNLPPLTNDLVWSVSYSATGVTLTAGPYVYPDGIVITNPPTYIVVSNEVDVYTVQGTAGPDIRSAIGWTNLLTGDSGVMAPISRWTVADVTLGVGSNEIRVTGFADQATAFDTASNSVYASGWTNSANGGFGWSGGWTLESGPQGGHFRGTIGSNPNMSTGPFGWGMWANSGGYSAARRSFPPLLPSHGFICQFDNNSVQVGGSVGLSFQNSEGTNLFEMYLLGGQSTYFINDSLGSRSSGISTSSAGWVIYFQPVGADGYLFQMNGIIVTGTMMSATNQQVSRVRAFNSNSGTGQAADFFIDDFQVVDLEAIAVTGSVVITRLGLGSGDTDGDGLPDWWESRYGLNPNVSNAAPADADWMTDWEEYIADTDPTNSASFFPNIILTNPPPGTMAIVINPTSTSRVYNVQWSTNLLIAPQVWTVLPPEKTGTGSAVQFNVTNDAPGRSYRTGVRLP